MEGWKTRERERVREREREGGECHPSETHFFPSQGKNTNTATQTQNHIQTKYKPPFCSQSAFFPRKPPLPPKIRCIHILPHDKNIPPLHRWLVPRGAPPGTPGGSRPLAASGRIRTGEKKEGRKRGRRRGWGWRRRGRRRRRSRRRRRRRRGGGYLSRAPPEPHEAGPPRVASGGWQGCRAVGRLACWQRLARRQQQQQQQQQQRQQ